VTDGPGYPASQHEFLLRRLHSLAGLLPIGAFLVFHLGTNATVALNGVAGEDVFQTQVDRIHALGPLVYPLEILFIFLPLAFHAGLGVKMWLQGQPNTTRYPYWGNIRYTLQRVTGVIALLFILVHLWQMHWLGGLVGGGGYFNPKEATGTAAGVLQFKGAWVAPFYALGTLAAVFHFANGIWTGLITWGITVGRNAQRKAGYVCAVVGLVLAVFGLSSIRSLMHVPDAVPPTPRHGASAPPTARHEVPGRHPDESRPGRDGAGGHQLPDRGADLQSRDRQGAENG
jgi:succinate dehydrogenase / fumarate reductase cytochrome b subunit